MIHLSQRRGFLSNRKADRGRKDETKGMLGEISQLETDLRGNTLGSFLAGEQELNPHVRLRRRHTRRDMYEREFEAIWSAQREHYPELLTERLKYGTEGKQTYPCDPQPRGKKSALELFGIHGCLFFQRSLYPPKSVIGACELEPNMKRCPRAYLQAQRFRLLQEVNNIRVLERTVSGERPLTGEERLTLIQYLGESKERSFDDMRKKLKLDGALFNLRRRRTKEIARPANRQTVKESARKELSNSRSAQKCLQLLDKCNGVS